MGILFITLFVILYVIRLIISYFIFKKIYIEKPYLIDFSISVAALIPIIGLFATLVYSEEVEIIKKEKILNFIFRIKN